MTLLILLKQILSVYFYLPLKGVRKHHGAGSQSLISLIDSCCIFLGLVAWAFGQDKLALNIVIARFVLLLPFIWYYVHLETLSHLPETMEEWQRGLLDSKDDDKSRVT